MFTPRQFLLSCAVLLFLHPILGPRSQANEPLYSKKAVHFLVRCEGGRKNCNPFKVWSPDHKSFVQVSYEPLPEEPNDSLVSLTVTSHGANLGEITLPGFVEDEIVWAPDSRAFFINGSSNGYSDFHFAVCRLIDSRLSVVIPTQNVLRDMVRSFPPCRAKTPYKDCEGLAADPAGYIGTAAIDWLADSSAIVVMAEVTCSSSMGVIWCAVLGYELEIPSGKILRRMEPKEFAAR
jgi:hypothetical protein